MREIDDPCLTNTEIQQPGGTEETGQQLIRRRTIKVTDAPETDPQEYNTAQSFSSSLHGFKADTASNRAERDRQGEIRKSSRYETFSREGNHERRRNNSDEERSSKALTRRTMRTSNRSTRNRRTSDHHPMPQGKYFAKEKEYTHGRAS